MPERECWHCDETFESGDALVDHLTDEGVYDDATLGVVRHASQ